MTRIRTLIAVLSVFILLGTTQAMACPVCFGDKNSAEVEGARWAILFLLGVTGTVLSGVASLLLYFRKRAKMTLNGSVDMPSPN